MRMMKNNNNETVTVIGIDHGYGNMKTATRCFPSGVARYDKEPIFQNNLLVYNGMYYQIGEEHKDFWGMGYITVILFAIIQNGAFQDDLINFFKIPFIWYVRFCDWLVYPTCDNGFNQKIAYTGKEAWINRILAIVAALFILAIMIVIIVEVIKRYKRMWDEISQMFLVGSLSGIAVLGEIIREYLPVNLILLFGFINVGIMLLRIYLQKNFNYL